MPIFVLFMAKTIMLIIHTKDGDLRFCIAVRGCRQPQLWVLLVPIENWLARSSLDCYPARKAANVNQNAFGTFDLGPIAIVCC